MNAPVNSKLQSIDSDQGTPPEIIEPMREVMGGSIQCDPCTSELFNSQIVHAATYFDEAANGLEQIWRGSTWVNAPGGLADYRTGRMIPRNEKGVQVRNKYSVSAPRLWWERLVMLKHAGMVTEFGYEAFSIEQLATLQKVKEPYPKITDFAFCILEKRLKHLKLDPSTGELVRNKQPTHFSAIVYGGPHYRQFKRLFSKLGSTGRLR